MEDEEVAGAAKAEDEDADEVEEPGMSSLPPSNAWLHVVSWASATDCHDALQPYIGMCRSSLFSAHSLALTSTTHVICLSHTKMKSTKSHHQEVSEAAFTVCFEAASQKAAICKDGRARNRRKAK